MQMDVLPHQRVLAVIADLIGRVPGLAPDLVQGGVLRELIRLVRHPVFGCGNGDDNMAEEHSDSNAAEELSSDNLAKENCDVILAQFHTDFMKQMVDVLRAFARQLPQVRPRLPSAAVQPGTRCTSPDSTRVAASAWSTQVPAMASEPFSCQGLDPFPKHVHQPWSCFPFVAWSSTKGCTELRAVPAVLSQWLGCAGRSST